MSQESFVEVDGARIWYRVSGLSSAEPPLLLVHGSGANHWWWHAMVPFLQRRHRVVEMDLSGHGDSDHRLPYSIEGWVREMKAVLDAAEVSRAVLVGHSMGGKLSVAAAATYASSVAGLVLFDVALPPAEHWRDRAPWMEGRPRHVASRDELVARFALAPKQAQPDARALRPVAEGSVRHEADGWCWKHDRRQMPILDDRLIGSFALQVECPISFVYAEHSYAVDEAVLAHVRTSLRAPVTLTRVEGAHHHLVLEQPRHCTELVTDFSATVTA